MQCRVVEADVYKFRNKQDKKRVLERLGLNRKEVIIDSHLIIIVKEKIDKKVVGKYVSL